MALTKEALLIEVAASAKGAQKELDKTIDKIDEMGEVSKKTSSKSSQAMQRIEDDMSRLARTINNSSSLSSALAVDQSLVKESISQINDSSMGMTRLAKSINDTNKALAKSNTGNLNNNLKSANVEVVQLSDNLKNLENVSGDSIGKLVKDTSKLTNVFGKAAGVFGSIGSGISKLTTGYLKFEQILNSLTDPDKLQKIANLFKILAVLAKLKGKPELAENLRKASDEVVNFAALMENFQNSTDDNFNSIAKTMAAFEFALDALKVTAFAAGAALTTLTVSGIVGGLNKLKPGLISTNNLLRIFGLHSNDSKIFSNAFAKVLKVNGRTIFNYRREILNTVKSTKDLTQTFVAVTKSTKTLRTGILSIAKTSTIGAQQISLLQKSGLLVVDFFERSLPMAITKSISSIKTFSIGFKKGFTEPIKAASRFLDNVAIGSISKTSSSLAKFGVTAAKKVAPSLLTLTEAGVTLGPVLASIGLAALRSENGLIKLAGFITTGLAIALVGLASVVAIAASSLGGFAAAIGDNLISKVEEFEKKAAKAALGIKQFQFVVEGFGRQLGVLATGSLQLWNDQLSRVVDESLFTASSVRKSIKLIIAEGARLGLSIQQRIKILDTAKDVASGTGKEIDDVTQRILDGIAGQSQGLQKVGILIGENALAHSHLAEQMGKSVSQMNDVEKQQLRVAEIFDQSIPLIGAAANEVDTLIGSQVKLEQTLGRIETTFGKQSDATKEYNKAINSLASAFLELPEGILVATGASIDYLGVSLKIVGTLLQYTILIASVTTLWKVFNSVLVSAAATSFLLNSGFAKLGATVGATTLITNSLSRVFQNLVIIIRAGLVLALREAAKAVVVLGIRFAKFTAMLLVNPLFIKAAIIVAGIIALVQAIKELKTELDFLGDSAEKAGNQTTIFNTVITESIKIVKRLGRIITIFIKQSLIGWISAALLLEKAWLKTKRIFASGKELKEIDKQLVENQMNLIKLGDLARTNSEKMAQAMGLSAAASDMATVSHKRHNKALELLAARQKELSDIIAGVTTLSEVRLAVGDEFERLQIQINDAKIMQDKASISFLKSHDKQEEAVKNLTKSIKDQAIATARLNKMRGDTFKKFEGDTKRLNIEALKNSGLLVQAQMFENDLKLASFDKEIMRLNQVFKLRENEIRIINEKRKAIVKANEAALKQASIQQSKGKKGDKELGPGAAIQANIDTINKAFEPAANKAGNTMGNIAGEAFGKTAGGVFGALASGAVEGLGGLLTGAASAIGSGLLGVVDMFADAALALIDFLPGLIDKFAAIFNNLTDLPAKLAESILGLFDSIINFVSNFIPMLIKAIGDILLGLADFLIELPNALIDLISTGIPDAFQALFDKLPEIITKLIFGLITFLPKLIVAGISIFTKMIPKVFVAVIKAIPAMVQAIIDGVKEALKEIANLFFSLFNGNSAKITKKVEDQFKKLGDAATGAVSDVFKVSDLAKQVGAEGDKSPADAVIEAGKKAADFLTKAWRKLWKWVKGVWKGLMNFLQVVWEGIVALWRFVWNGIIEIWRKAWMVAVEAWRVLWDGIVGILEGLFQIASDIFNDFVMALLKVFRFFADIGEDIVRGLMFFFSNTLPAAVKFAFNIVAVLWDSLADVVAFAFKLVGLLWETFPAVVAFAFKLVGLLWDSLAEVVSFAWEVVATLWSSLGQVVSDAWKFVSNLWEGLKDVVGQAWAFVSQLWEDLGSIVSDAFKIVTLLWESLGAVVSDAWKFVSNLWEGLKNVVSQAWAFVSQLWEDLKTIVSSAFGFVTKLWDGFKDIVGKAFEPIKNLFSGMADAINFDGIKKGFTDIFSSLGDSLNFSKIGVSLQNLFSGISMAGIGQNFTNMFDALNPANLLNKMFKKDGGGTGTVEKLLGIDVPFVSFAGGGKVPGIASMTGDSKENDKILSLLSPGEVVLPRSVTKDKNIMALINQILEGNLPGFAFGGGIKIGGDLGKLGEATKSGLKQLGENISSIAEGLADQADKIKDKMVEGIRTMIGGTLSREGLGAPLTSTSSTNTGALFANTILGGVDLSAGISAGVGSQLSALGLQNGGIVPGSGTGDSVPALLEPGELVIPRDLVSGLRGGNRPTVNQSFVFEIEINTEQKVDEEFIRENLLPLVLDDIRRESLEGKRVIERTGVR